MAATATNKKESSTRTQDMREDKNRKHDLEAARIIMVEEGAPEEVTRTRLNDGHLLLACG